MSTEKLYGTIKLYYPVDMNDQHGRWDFIDCETSDHCRYSDFLLGSERKFGFRRGLHTIKQVKKLKGKLKTRIREIFLT